MSEGSTVDMLSDNILRLKGQISSVCSKLKRDPASVIIVAVSKNRTITKIKEAVASGIRDIGENRVQEAALKYKELANLRTYERITPKWHMVGHLQRNKVKEAVRIFDLIHSVDSARLALEIDRQATVINKIQDILVEVKTYPEEPKFGLKADEAIEVIKKISQLKNLNLKGLMTIAPIVAAPEDARPYFRMLRELQSKINKLGIINYGLQTLSMGMTDDFEVAIEEGSTMVRLGRAIFD
ncbi:MAG: YggS family pyridoxal phosphate-dependent enzyme [Candidatus Omnitrophica bacterium]|nr:YggS family pyridoxal phosphate-dependent enzyme [Candidatus Omnitrophota bacterium]